MSSINFSHKVPEIGFIAKEVDNLASDMKGYHWTMRSEGTNSESTTRKLDSWMLRKEIIYKVLSEYINKVELYHQNMSPEIQQNCANFITELFHKCSSVEKKISIIQSTQTFYMNHLQGIDPRVEKLFAKTSSSKPLTNEKISRYRKFIAILREEKNINPQSEQKLNEISTKLLQINEARTSVFHEGNLVDAELAYLAEELDSFASDVKGYHWTMRASESSLADVEKKSAPWNERRIKLFKAISKVRAELESMPNSPSNKYCDEILLIKFEKVHNRIKLIFNTQFFYKSNSQDVDPRAEKLLTNILNGPHSDEKKSRYQQLIATLQEENFNPQTEQKLNQISTKFIFLNEANRLLEAIKEHDESTDPIAYNKACRALRSHLMPNLYSIDQTKAIRFKYDLKNPQDWIYSRGVFEDNSGNGWDEKDAVELEYDNSTREWIFHPPADKGEFKFVYNNNIWETGLNRKVGDLNRGVPRFNF